MPTILDICNAALNACGSDDVLTGLNNGVITDANKSGRLCNQNYNLARRAVLAKHPWKFSIVRVVIPIVADVTLQPPFGGRNACSLLPHINIQPPYPWIPPISGRAKGLSWTPA